MEKTLSRKERRKTEQSNEVYRNMKKSAAVMGTTLSACSIVTPLMNPVSVDAVETSQAQTTASNFAAPNTSAFIAEISSYAQPIANANDLYASVMIAQAIIESGWGQSGLSQAPNYNLFGIKGSYNGQTVYMNTSEYLNGKWVTMKEPFKKYPSYSESFADNARTLRTVSFQSGVYYYSGTWKSNTSSYRDATAWLTGRYATAPNYASSLNNVIQQYNLTRYDTPATGNAGGGATTGTNTGTNGGATSGTSNNTASGSYYTVVSGDSVWGISNKHGITMAQLISWNNIKNNFVYPGQKLIVKQGASTGNTSNSTGTTGGGTTTSGTNNNTTSSSYYTVAAGESVWGISNKHGITMAQLISWNNIKNNFVYPGQKLIVKQGASTGNASNSTATTGGGTATSGTNSSTASGSYYTVVSGDSVWGISNKHGITMAQLISWNNIKNNFVYPGQKLIVKQGTSTGNASSNTATTNTNTSTSSTTANTGSTTGDKYYTVAPGESVWGISNKHGITMAQLISWNNIKNNFVYPGQKVIVKKASQTTTNTATANPTNNSSTYTVASGESVWGISHKFGITMDQFCSWNNIKNNFVYPGQKVRIK